MEILREYGVATHIYVPMIKRGVVDFAVGADWTPAAGDVKISKDGGAAANVTNLPTAIAMGNGAYWDFSLVAAEMQAAQIVVTVADSATKAVEDQSFLLATYGNASARHKVNLNDSVRAGLTALPNAAAEAAGGLYTRGAGAGQINQDANGRVDTNAVAWRGTALAAPATAGIPKVAIEAAGDFAQAAADKVWSSATRTLTAFSTALALSVWDVLDASIGTASSVGLRLKGLTFTTANKVDAAFNAAADFPQACADKVWSTAARALTDKAGFSLSAGSIQAIWDALTANLTTVGSIGKLIVDNLNATITSVKALLPAALVGGRIDASVGNMQAAVITTTAHAVGAIDAAALATDAANEIRDAVLTAAVDGTTTLQESLRLHNAALGGKSSGLDVGAPVFRDLADTKDRITATTDANGNRSAVSRNLT